MAENQEAKKLAESSATTESRGDPVSAGPPEAEEPAKILHHDEYNNNNKKEKEPIDEKKEQLEEPKKVVSDEKSVKFVEDKDVPVIVQKIADLAAEKSSDEKSSDGPIGRELDAALAQVETEKRLALIKAWEESEKTKAQNKAYKKMSAVAAWENSKKAVVEAQLKQVEEKLEKKRSECEEKMKNKIAEAHKQAEERRAAVEAIKRQEFLQVDEKAAKFRASGVVPKKLLSCFSS